MPGSILNADINFPHFTGKESTDEKIDSIQSYLYMLYEQLRYSMANIGKENFNETELNDIISIAASKIDVSGVVTFHDLETAGETVINGANITTGTISADRLNLTGAITFGDLNASVQNAINGKASASQVSTIINQYMVSSPRIYGGTYYSITGGASLFIEGGGSYAYLKYTDDGIGQTVLQLVTESQGHGVTTDAYLQDVEFAWTDGYGIHFTGEDIQIQDAYVPNVIAGNGSFSVHPYGANSAYWEFDNGGIYFCSADGTRVSQVVLETL